MGKKLTYEYVKRYFEEKGCELLEKKYKNNNIKMKYKCKCGNISTTRFNNFQQGKRCKKCGDKESSNKNRHTLTYVCNYFKKYGCELLEKEYINCDTKMKYKCICDIESFISFSNFKAGKRCKKCGDKNGANKRKFSYKYVKKYFKKQGCELLNNKYCGIFSIVSYICQCGEKNKIVFNDFKQGHRCKKCGIKKRSGKNHYNYNPSLTDEEREKNKSRTSDYYYRIWRLNIFVKNNFTCQKCFQRGGRLNAYHIENYATNEELRLDIDNGITFCKNCHIEFHKIYGKINNNKQQLYEFLNIKNLKTG